jgi:hypothetical protein
MGPALASVAFVTALVVGVALVLGAFHVLIRPREINARSATALRELEPRGGRHRFHVRLFEVVALACACTAAIGVLLVFAAAPEAEAALPIIGGGSMLVAVWWAWRRGALRAVEADPRMNIHVDVDDEGGGARHR